MTTAVLIDTARKNWQRGLPSWPRPLVDALEKSGCRSALGWAVSAVGGLVASARTDDEGAALSNDLDRLPSLVDLGRPPNLLKMGQDVWHRDGPVGRDDYQTAVARLYFAAHFYLRNEHKAYVQEISAALAVCCRQKDEVDKVLGLFADLSARATAT